MDMARTRSEANKADDSKLIKNIKGITDVFTSYLIYLQTCLLSSTWSIALRQAVVTNLKWIDNRFCSILLIIAHQKQQWCSWSNLS